jgi:hypothetical protein
MTETPTGVRCLELARYATPHGMPTVLLPTAAPAAAS